MGVWAAPHLHIYPSLFLAGGYFSARISSYEGGFWRIGCFPGNIVSVRIRKPDDEAHLGTVAYDLH